MDIEWHRRLERLARLEDALGPGEGFGRHRLWSVPSRLGDPIKLWLRPGLGDDLCRAWVFYPGRGDDRDAEEFRIQTPEQLDELLRRIGASSLRGRGRPSSKSQNPGREAGR